MNEDRKKKNINKNFFKTWSGDMAYTLGFILADGTFDITKRGGYYFGLHITDYEILDKIRKIMGSNHKISKRSVKEGEKPRYRLQIGSKEMCNDLLALGVVPKKTKQFDLPNIPNKYLFDLVRGYFDGDGNVWCGYINKDRIKKTYVLQLTFTSGNVEFIRNLKLLLNDRGVSGGGIYHCSKRDFARLTFSTRSALFLYKNMYKDCQNDLYIPRKKNRFTEFIKERNIAL